MTDLLADQPRTVDAAVYADGHLLLVEQGDGWALPGGLAGVGESDVDAMVRQLRDGIGIDLVREVAAVVYSGPADDRHVAAELWVTSRLTVFRLDRLPEPTRPSAARAGWFPVRSLDELAAAIRAVGGAVGAALLPLLEIVLNKLGRATMNAIAVVRLVDNTVTAESTVTVPANGVQVARGPVSARTDRAGFLAPARVVAALAALGWRPVDYYRQRPAPGGVEPRRRAGRDRRPARPLRRPAAGAATAQVTPALLERRDTMSDTVHLRWQFCRDGYDITTDCYAEQDADEARAWDGDFCFVAVVRDANNPKRWRVDSTDGRLSDDADEHLFASPAEAVAYLATRQGVAYEFTTEGL